MKAVWTLEQGARTRASPGGEAAAAEQALPPGAESNAATTRVATGRPRADVPQPEPPLRLADAAGRGSGPRRSERQADAGAEAHRPAVARRRLELPRLGGGDEHPLLIAVGRRHQMHVLDRRRIPRRRTPACRSAPPARRAAGSSGRCGRISTAGVTCGIADLVDTAGRDGAWRGPHGRGRRGHDAAVALGDHRRRRSAATAAARPTGAEAGRSRRCRGSALRRCGRATKPGWRSADGGAARSGPRRGAGARRRTAAGHRRRAGDRAVRPRPPSARGRCRRRADRATPQRRKPPPGTPPGRRGRRRSGGRPPSLRRSQRAGPCRRRRAWPRPGAVSKGARAARRRARVRSVSASSAAARRARSSAGSARSATAASTSWRPGRSKNASSDTKSATSAPARPAPLRRSAA